MCKLIETKHHQHSSLQVLLVFFGGCGATNKAVSISNELFSPYSFYCVGFHQRSESGQSRTFFEHSQNGMKSIDLVVPGQNQPNSPKSQPKLPTEIVRFESKISFNSETAQKMTGTNPIRTSGFHLVDATMALIPWEKVNQDLDCNWIFADNSNGKQ